MVLGLAGVVALAVIGFWLTLGGFAARVDMRRGTRLVLFGTFGAVLLAAGALLFLSPYRLACFPDLRRDPCAYPPNYYAEHHIDVAKLCGPGRPTPGRRTPGEAAGATRPWRSSWRRASLLTLVVLGTAVVMALVAVVPARSSAAENAPVLEALDESLEDCVVNGMCGGRSSRVTRGWNGRWRARVKGGEHTRRRWSSCDGCSSGWHRNLDRC